jgi:hypothetical protein
VKNEILKRKIEKILERLYKTIRSRRYKYCVIKELLQTEFNYIKDLEVIEYVSVENIPDQRQSRLFNIILD